MKSFFASLADEALVCARCGYCQAVCPVFAESGWESSGPRGHMAAALEAARGHALGPEHARRIYECTLCGHCREVCATRIDTVEAWGTLREQLAREGMLDRWPLAKIRDNLRSAHSITGEAPENRLLWQADLEAPAAALNGQQGAEVVYFVGCVAGLYPQTHAIPQTTTQILAKAGVSFTTLGGEEWCCGFPLLGMGLKEDAAAVARHNVEQVKALGAKMLVAACPSCYHTWRDTYPALLGADHGLRVLHASELYAELLASGTLVPQPLEERVTYHDPCDLGRNSGIYDAPRQALAAIPGLELVEMADNRERALCCGGGGNMEAVNPDLVAAIAARRIRQALDTGARTIVTPCQQCKRTLTNAARRSRAKLKVVDLSEIIWRALE